MPESDSDSVLMEWSIVSSKTILHDLYWKLVPYFWSQLLCPGSNTRLQDGRTCPKRLGYNCILDAYDAASAECSTGSWEIDRFWIYCGKLQITVTKIVCSVYNVYSVLQRLQTFQKFLAVFTNFKRS